jgi:hypothetical protein
MAWPQNFALIHVSGSLCHPYGFAVRESLFPPLPRWATLFRPSGTPRPYIAFLEQSRMLRAYSG